MTIRYVGVDADDTLWHNERSFMESYDLFAEVVEPWLSHLPDPAAAAHDLLVATERRNIAAYGYGIKGATLSMIEAAMDISDQQVSTAQLHRLVERAKEMMSLPVDVIDDAPAALRALAEGPVEQVLLLTKGDVMDQRRKIHESGLESLFDAVEILHEKDAATYREVLDRHDIEPTHFAMVGNSLRSDVLPVLQLGGWGVHVPYTSTWALEHAEEPLGHPRFTRVERLRDAVAVLHAHNERKE